MDKKKEMSKLALQFHDELYPSSTKTRRDDPAYRLLHDRVTSTPVVHSDTCYICNDPEFAQMGLPLCRKCPACGGHVPADDSVCDNCGMDDRHFREAVGAKKREWVNVIFSTGYPGYKHKIPTEEELAVALTAYDREILEGEYEQLD